MKAFTVIKKNPDVFIRVITTMGKPRPLAGLLSRTGREDILIEIKPDEQDYVPVDGDLARRFGGKIDPEFVDRVIAAY